MQFTYRAAPCLMANRSMPIAEAIDTMLKHNSTYLVIVDEKRKMSGIFTRGDLFRQYRILAEKDSFTKPIGNLCTMPVKSITTTLMHTAPAFMLRHKISHVPVIDIKEDRQTLVGILTERAIFEMIVKMKRLPDSMGGTAIFGQRNRQLAVISPDGTSYESLNAVFQVSKYVAIKRLWMANLTTPESLQRAAQENDAIIMDIDGAPETRWKQIFKFFYEHPDLENICLLYDPEEHPKDIRALLNKLDENDSGWLHLYQKPIDIAMMILDLEKNWNADDSQQDRIQS